MFRTGLKFWNVELVENSGLLKICRSKVFPSQSGRVKIRNKYLGRKEEHPGLENIDVSSQRLPCNEPINNMKCWERYDPWPGTCGWYETHGSPPNMKRSALNDLDIAAKFITIAIGPAWIKTNIDRMILPLTDYAVVIAVVRFYDWPLFICFFFFFR